MHPAPPLTTTKNHQQMLIIFDLDGTLVDSAPDIAAAANAMRIELGYPAQSLEQVKQWIGNGSAMLVRRALADVHGTAENGVSEQEFAQAHELFFKHYRQCNGQHSRLYPQVAETLEALTKKHYLLAICTNKPTEFTHALLKHLQLDTTFSSIVSGDTLPVKKPDPAPLLLCAQQCGASIEQSLMVGDSMTDINAAHNARMNVVAVSYGYHRGADLSSRCPTIPSLQHLLELL